MLGHYFGQFSPSKTGKPIILNEEEKKVYPHSIRSESIEFYSSLPIQEISDHQHLLKLVIFGEITYSFDKNKSLHKNEEIFEIKELYLKYGDSLGKYLDGLFLILIFDEKKEQLLIINNRYQCTTAYYQEIKNTTRFSNSLTTLCRHSEERKPHFGSIRSFISNGFTIPDQTQIQGIKKLLPSFWLKLTLEDKSLEHHWRNEFNFNRRDKLGNLESELDHYENLYRNGLERYLDKRETKELGTLLSGGHDTSFTMIQASKVFDKPVHAFTVTFKDWAWDESSFAENICLKNGGIFHPVPFEPEDLDLTVSMIKGNEEPVVGSSLPLHKLAKIASNHVDTMLGGDGGDTLWGEYFPVGEYHQWVKAWPTWMRSLAHKTSKALVGLTDWERFWELQHVSQLFVEEDYYKDFMRKLCTYRHFDFEFQKELFTENVFKEPLPASALEIEFNSHNFQNSLIEGKLFNAFYTYQSFSTTKSMEHFGMPLYLPTINKEVMDYITTLPTQWINGGTTFHRLTNNKTINRRFHKMALNRYLKHEEIYNRSFDIPWYRILKPRKKVLELLQNRLINRGWYQGEAIEKLFKEFLNQEAKEYELLELKHHGYRIFTLLSMEIWASEYIDGRFSTNVDDGINLEEYLES